MNVKNLLTYCDCPPGNRARLLRQARDRALRAMVLCLLALMTLPGLEAVAADFTPDWAKGVTYNDENRWYQVTSVGESSKFSGGDGTSTKPYLISKEHDLALLQYWAYKNNTDYTGTSSKKVYYKLTKDLNMLSYNNGTTTKYARCTTIGDRQNDNYAYIDFDGGGHTIYNVVMPYDTRDYSDNGIFGRLFNSKIHDVTFDHYYIASTSDGDYIGLVGYMKNSTLENVHVKNGFVAGGSNIGGLVGRIEGNSGDGKTVTSYIINCSFEGKVYSRYTKNLVHFGGLVGVIRHQQLKLYNSMFRGALYTDNGRGNGRGGLVGYMGAGDTHIYISGCAVMGEFDGKDRYNCPLNQKADNDLGIESNGFAVANVHYKTSYVYFDSPLLVSENSRYKSKGDILACSGDYGKNSSNVKYLNNGQYVGLTDGGNSMIKTITDTYEGAYKINDCAYTAGTGRAYFSMNKGNSTSGTRDTIAINKKDPISKITIKGVTPKSLTVDAGVVSGTDIYAQKNAKATIQIAKDDEDRAKYPTSITENTNPVAWEMDKSSINEKNPYTVYRELDYDVLPHNITMNINYEALPVATNVKATLNSYRKKCTLTWDKSKKAGYYAIYRGNNRLGVISTTSNESKCSYVDNNVPISIDNDSVYYEIYYVSSNTDTDKVLDATIPMDTKFPNLKGRVKKHTKLANELVLRASKTAATAGTVNVELVYPKETIYSQAAYNVYSTDDPKKSLASGKLATVSTVGGTLTQLIKGISLPDACETYSLYCTVNLGTLGSQNSPNCNMKADGAIEFEKVTVSKGDMKGNVSININIKSTSNLQPIKYVIERKLANEDDKQYIQLYTLKTLDTQLTQIDDKVSPGNIYKYRIKAFSGCNNKYSDNHDALYEDYGFCQAKGSVSGRITYNGNNAVDNVAVYISTNANTDQRQYTSAYFDGKAGEIDNDSVQGITFDDLQDLNNMANYTLQFFMKPHGLANKVSDYGINVASVPQVVLAVIPPADSINGDYRLAPLSKADGDYIDGESGSGNDGSELYKATDGSEGSITGDLSAGVFTNVFLQRNGDRFRIGVLGKHYASAKDNVGTDSIIWYKEFAANMNNMEDDYKGKLTFARPAGIDYASYMGWIDDIRLWKGEKTDAELLKYASNILSGTEPGLELYVNFDENIATHCFDMSGHNNVRNSHHARAYAMTCDDVIPEKEQLGLKGITDADGNYIISGIPFSGEGTLYTVTPVYGTHTFNPTSQQLYISESSLVANKTDFSDESSFPVKINATYLGTMLPVEGASILVDGASQFDNGKELKTDADGLATVNVPIGRHRLTLSKQSHTFACGGTACDPDTAKMFDPSGAGWIDVPKGLDLDQALTFVDATTVRLVGRAVGGAKESSLGHNFGLSKNNIGQVQIQLKPTSAKHYDMHRSEWNENGNPSHTVNNNNENVNSTTTYDANFITILTDPATGEYDAIVPPIDFQTASITTVGGTEQGDYRRLLADDFGGNVKIEPRVGQAMTDSTYIDGLGWKTYEYNALNDFTYYIDPTFIVTSGDETYPNMYGEKEYAYSDSEDSNNNDIIKLWSDNKELLKVGGPEAYTLGYPVFTMLNKYKMNIEAYEIYCNRDYANVNRPLDDEYHQPLDSVEVVVTNQMATKQGVFDSQNVLQLSEEDATVTTVTLDRLGQGVYEFRAGFPNYNDDHTLPLSMRAEVHGKTYIYPSEDKPFKGIVLGSNVVPGDNFVTAGPNIVDFVLHDPPGSNSYATLSEGSTVSASHSMAITSGGENNVGVKFSWGVKYQTVQGTTAAGSVFAVLSESNLINEGEAGVSSTWSAEDNDSWNISYTLGKDISTSASPDYVGADGDIFIGSSTNVTISQTKKLDFVRVPGSGAYEGGKSQYNLQMSDAMSAGLDYNTAFVYTQKHIKETLIPMIRDLRRSLIPEENIVSSLTGLGANNSPTPKYYALPTTDFEKSSWERGVDYEVVFNDAEHQADTVNIYSNWLKDWEGVLAKNEEVKLHCINNLHDKKTFTYHVGNKEYNYNDNVGNRTITADYGYLGNKSFDAGSTIDEQAEMSSEHESSCSYGGTAGIIANLLVGSTFNKFGVQAVVETNNQVGEENSDSETTSGTRTLAYHLEDQDAGDYFSVDVYLPAAILPSKTDGLSGSTDVGEYGNQSYVFVTRGGQSKCPYEGPALTQYFRPGQSIGSGTTPVDAPQMVIANTDVAGVASGKSATFVTTLSSESTSKLGSWYQLSVEEGSNPYGLELSVDGQPLATPRLFYLNPGESVQKTIVAKQTRSDVLNYNVNLCFGSNCDDNIVKTIPISVEFVPASTDVTLKLSDITVNTLTEKSSVTFTLTDFDRQFTNFAIIRLKYRRKGESSWLTLHNFINNQQLLEDVGKMPKDTTSFTMLESAKVLYTWDMSKLVDGDYEVIAEAASLHGYDEVTTTTDIQTITLDLTAPTIIGQPTPTNGILTADSEVSVTFNEDIQHTALTFNNFAIDAHLNNQVVGHDAALNFSPGSEPAATEANISLTGDFTIEGWYKREAGKAGTLLKHGDKLELGVNASNTMRLVVNGKTYESVNVPVTNQEIDSDWQYFQLTYDSGNRTMTLNNLYGVESDKNKLCFIKETLTEPYSNRARLYVGGDLSGQMHELRMYNVWRDLTEAVASKSETMAGTEDNLTGYWPASEGHGGMATDKARSRNLKVNGSWYISERNFAPHFDGKQHMKLSVGSTPISSKQSMLMEFWFRGNTQDSAATLVGSEHFTKDNPGLYVGVNDDNKLVLGSMSTETVLSDNNYMDGNWHHFALNVLHGSNATAYVDGVNVKQMPATSVSPVETSNLILGANNLRESGEIGDKMFNHFKGAIDEFRLWRVRTTADVIRDRMYKRMNGDEPGLVGYYPFEATEVNSGQTVTVFSLANKAAISAEQTGDAVMSDNVAFDSDDTPALLSPSNQLSRYSAQWTANERKIVLTPDLPKYRMEGCTLTFTVSDVFDSHGNRQSDPVVWSAFVNQNRLTWSERSVELKQAVEQSTTFTVDINNGGSEAENWVLKNVPSWLSVNKESGTLKPLDSERLTFTVSPATSIGQYDETIYLTGNDGMNSPLAINLKVNATAPNWTVDEHKYSSSMSLIGRLNFGADASEDEDDLVAAFNGDECVGVASPMYVQSYDSYLLMMNIYGDTNGSELRFKAWKASTGVVYPKVSINNGAAKIDTLRFAEDRVAGSLAAPYQLTAEDYIEQTIALNKGWNWMALYTTPDDLAPSSIFRNVVEAYNGNESFVVKDKNAFWQHDKQGNGGKLTSMNLSDMYMVYTPQEADLNITGRRTSPATVDITLTRYWNWIGAPIEGVCTLDRAYADAEPISGDVVKTKSKFAVYDGSRWIGKLEYITPGQGCKYYSAETSTTPKVFHYPETFASTMARAPRLEEDNKFWSCDNSPYQGNMTVVAQVYCDGVLMNDVELGAFNGKECRGSEISENNGLIFLTIAGDESVQLSLSVYDHITGKEYSNVVGMQYKDNAMIGNLNEPFRVNVVAAGIDDLLIDDDTDATYYDVLGRRYSDPEPGIYIRNGQKVIVRSK